MTVHIVSRRVRTITDRLDQLLEPRIVRSPRDQPKIKALATLLGSLACLIQRTILMMTRVSTRSRFIALRGKATSPSCGASSTLAIARGEPHARGRRARLAGPRRAESSASRACSSMPSAVPNSAAAPPIATGLLSLCSSRLPLYDAHCRCVHETAARAFAHNALIVFGRCAC